MPFVSLSASDPALDLVALIEKITEVSTEAKSSPLAQLVGDKNYTQLLEQGVLGQMDALLAKASEAGPSNPPLLSSFSSHFSCVNMA